MINIDETHEDSIFDEVLEDFGMFKEINGSIDKDSEEIRLRNRKAAKKWREKRNESLSQLEALNDKLRNEALKLYSDMKTVRGQNQVLEKEIEFFQKFVSQAMGNSMMLQRRTV